MDVDAVLLARFQFAFMIAFHILFPTLTIGLAGFLVVLEARWLKTGEAVYRELYRFWARIFALAFGLGVISGIPMSFQFGTNWSAFSQATGNVMGPLLGYEVLTAFFLEASFLGIMLFGWNRVGPRLHFLSTVMVAFGTLLSAFWILSANSWMHTPAGFRLEDGVFFVESWWAVVFNPSFPYRLAHMVTAAYLTSAMVIAGVSAYHLLRGISVGAAKRAFSMGLWGVAVLAPLQILIGDLHGLNTQTHQPVKIAAMEGLWETRPAAPFVVFAWPDQDDQTNRLSIEIPYAASLILKHDPHGVVQGLDQVPPADQPNVPLVFFSFRIMLAMGGLMLAVGVIGLWLRWRGGVYDRRWFLRLCALSGPAGFLATLAGWIVTEVGRQPWTVHGLMRTADSASPVAAATVMTSLMLFIVIYNLLLAAFLYFIWRTVAKGPADGPPPDEARQAPGYAGWAPAQAQTPAR